MELRTILITQARTGSRRLPGKVLKTVGGVSLLQTHLERAKRSKLATVFVVATTTKPEDDAVAETGKTLGWEIFRGSELDVLDRYYKAAVPYDPDLIVRITADCPVSDADVIDKCINKCISEKADYCSNTMKRTFPDGLDVEVFRFSALKKAYEDAHLPEDREHVTPYIYRNGTYSGKNLFHTVPLLNETDLSSLRLTVDESDDMELIGRLFSELGSDLHWKKYADHLLLHPELSTINSGSAKKYGSKKN